MALLLTIHGGSFYEVFGAELNCENPVRKSTYIGKLSLPGSAGAVTAMYSGIDFTKDGVNDIVVGRDDGGVEIFGLDETQKPELVYSTRLTESVTSIDGGFITSPNSQVTPLKFSLNPTHSSFSVSRPRSCVPINPKCISAILAIETSVTLATSGRSYLK